MLINDHVLVYIIGVYECTNWLVARLAYRYVVPCAHARLKDFDCYLDGCSHESGFPKGSLSFRARACALVSFDERIVARICHLNSDWGENEHFKKSSIALSDAGKRM